MRLTDSCRDYDCREPVHTSGDGRAIPLQPVASKAATQVIEFRGAPHLTDNEAHLIEPELLGWLCMQSRSPQ